MRVVLNGFHNDTNGDQEGMYTGLTEKDEELPDFWPRPVKTDAEGRFTIRGVPEGVYATLSFWHPDFAVDEVIVSTMPDGTISPVLKAFEIIPVKPTFTHTLEPARPVQGRVTDKSTGKPLAGMPVEMIPMRRHGGMPFAGMTDADGRYRISGHQADRMYITTVYPRADSGYLATSDDRQGWPAGAKFLEVNFALEKGRLIHGKVLDKDTKQPVRGAAVMYQPGAQEPEQQEWLRPSKHGVDRSRRQVHDHRAAGRRDAGRGGRRSGYSSNAGARARCSGARPTRTDRFRSTYPRTVSRSRWRSPFARA